MSPLGRALGAAFVVGLVARLGAQVVLHAYTGAEPFEYEDIANNLLAGRGYSYMSGGITYMAAVSSPLYVYLTAGLYTLSGHSQIPMLILQAASGAASASAAAWLAARIFRLEAAWIAGILVACDPSLAVYAAKLHPLTFDALGFLVVVCACVALPMRPSWRQTAVAGLLLGIAALTRTTVLSFVPIVLVWLNRCRATRLISAASAALVLVAIVVYAPWPVHNSLALGQLVPGSSESTEWLWRGMNPNATGSSYTPDGRTMLQAAPEEFRTRIGQADETERMVLYRDAAADFARAHPLDAARLYLTKVKSFWFGSETTGLLYPAAWTVIYGAWYAAMLVLAVAGLIAAWRSSHPTVRGDAVLVLLALALVCLSQAAFYVEGRHRLAVEPLLLVLSGGGLVALAQRPALRFARLRRADRPAP